jgi:hypothetical protein
MNFTVGDRYVISCAAQQARVEWALRREVMVEWPWRTADTESKYRWDGTVAIPIDPSRLEWFQSPWRLEPQSGLKAGDPCQVSIPPTEVIVRKVHVFDEPRDIGWLPRPTAAVELVAAGEAEDKEDATFTIYLDSPEPIEFTPAPSR